MLVSVTEDLRWLKIESCTQEEYTTVRLAYNKPVEGYKFMPQFKKGLWDGHMNFLKKQYVPLGTIGYLQKTFAAADFPLEVEGWERVATGITPEEFTAWCGEFFAGSQWQPRDYQIEAAYEIVERRFSLSELATSAGKTLITYMVIAYLLKHGLAERVMMIVPTTALVIQSAEDFAKYNEGRDLQLDISQIYSGTEESDTANVVIGTFQSLVKKDNGFFLGFQAVAVDEVHRAKCASIQKILSKCWHTGYRFGLTGTIPKEKYADYLTITSHLGPLVTSVKARELQDRGFISKCDITQLELHYLTEQERFDLAEAMRFLKSDKGPQAAFQLEREIIITNPHRFGFLVNMMSRVTKNTLVLFHRIKFGEVLYERLKTACADKTILYIDGKVTPERRNEILKVMQENTGVILVASYATVGTGISVERIETVVFAESFKSPQIILQAIGRGLRLKRKLGLPDKVGIIDIVDDFRRKKPAFTNYMYLHGAERRSLYREAEYPFTMKKVFLVQD